MKIISDHRLRPDEVNVLVDDQVREEAKFGREIAEISLSLEGHEVAIEITHRSPIKRVRRITGYLSNIENFNPAKKAECRDRFVHAG